MQQAPSADAPDYVARAVAQHCRDPLEAGASEVVVWLVTSVLFSLLHAMNVLFGQSGRTTALQLVLAFFAGSALAVAVSEAIG